MQHPSTVSHPHSNRAMHKYKCLVASRIVLQNPPSFQCLAPTCAYFLICSYTLTATTFLRKTTTQIHCIILSHLCCASRQKVREISAFHREPRLSQGLSSSKEILAQVLRGSSTHIPGSAFGTDRNTSDSARSMADRAGASPNFSPGKAEDCLILYHHICD